MFSRGSSGICDFFPMVHVWEVREKLVSRRSYVDTVHFHVIHPMEKLSTGSSSSRRRRPCSIETTDAVHMLLLEVILYHY